MDIKGAMVAIVTPFKDGRVDEYGLVRLIEFQIDNGIDAIVPCGTTGESATLSYKEHERVIELTIDAVKGRVPVIAGTGSNSTEEAISLTKAAKKAGADAVLLITPYYNRPTQEGLFFHFKEIAKEVDIPQILYNVPSRTGVNLLPETVARLSKIENIIGIKEASGSMRQVTEIIDMCGDDFVVLSGEDMNNFPIISVGGKGMISVVANVAPSDVANMWDAYEQNDYKKARELHYKTFPLSRDLFLETNPVPVKTALALMGMITGELRLPLAPMLETNKKKLEKTLKLYGLLK
ncbi:MAG: 4-hydroxy-tetrahydrodipicolinate synthase [Deltaproteobacteria bacterium]|nr:4-hydroxy-tetrahydrodipicolinate synthase [Deltaproteobacteria bacterium]RLA87872.1 MAG: 4-hydroxy-tetrahydrodipicolinate synthase [Deltaproteobacteria bacterium]